MPVDSSETHRMPAPSKITAPPQSRLSEHRSTSDQLPGSNGDPFPLYRTTGLPRVSGTMGPSGSLRCAQRRSTSWAPRTSRPDHGCGRRCGPEARHPRNMAPMRPIQIQCVCVPRCTHAPPIRTALSCAHGGRFKRRKFDPIGNPLSGLPQLLHRPVCGVAHAGGWAASPKVGKARTIWNTSYPCSPSIVTMAPPIAPRHLPIDRRACPAPLGDTDTQVDSVHAQQVARRSAVMQDAQRDSACGSGRQKSGRGRDAFGRRTCQQRGESSRLR